MREARKTEPIMSADGEMFGLNLRADYVAEHEWGIEGIRMLFKMPGDDVLGIKRRVIGEFPEHKLILIDENHDLTLIAPIQWHSHLREDGPNVEIIDGILVMSGAPENYRSDACIPHGYQDDNGRYKIPRANDKKGKAKLFELTAGFYGAWDSKSFAVTARGDDQKKFLKTLVDAIRAKDLAIWLGRFDLSEHSGLNLLIASKIPESVRVKAYEDDLDHRNLTAAALSTGIAEIIQKAGLRYFSLRPKWADDSKTDVIFWLNPWEQQIHKYGWFTVQDLKDWANGRGPVMKSSDLG